MTASVLVTGAAGFVGGHLVESLVRDRSTVVAWYRPDGSLPGPRGALAEWRAVDVLDRHVVRSEIERARPCAIFHCAGAAHVGASWTDTRGTLELNVLGTHHLLEAVRRAGIRTRVLIPSSAAVYKPGPSPLAEDAELRPSSPYALSKLAQELFVAQMPAEPDSDIVIARAFNHLGPGQEPSYVASGIARQLVLIERGRSRPILEVGNVDARRDLTDVRDVVRAYRLLIERGRPSTPFNVCSGRALSVRELIRELVRMVGIAVEIRVDATRFRPNDPELVLGNPTRLQTEVGWKPEIPLERTLSDLLEYWRERAQSRGYETVDHPK